MDSFCYNFQVILINAVVDDPAQPGNPLVTFRLCVDGQQLPEVHRLKLKGFQTVDFENLDLRCRCEGNRKALGDALYRKVREAIAQQGLCGTYFSRTGWTTLDGTPVYVAGNRVIGPEGWVPPGQYVLAPELESLTLEVDGNILETHAAKYVRRLFMLHPGVTELLVAAAVVAHLFSLFEAARVRPRLVMYLVGPSMVGKTTLAQLIGRAYNRSATDDPQLVNLVSTTAAVHHRVSALSDCVCIVDDLYPSSSLAETRRREEKIGEIIRTTGNGAPKEKLTGNQVIPEVSRGVVFATAEYALTSFSTVARVVSLPMTNSIERQRLTAFQQDPKALSTFWSYFLRWASGHYNELVNFISSRFATLREAGTPEAKLNRGADAHQVLAVGVEILAQYMLSVNGEKRKPVEQMLSRFQNVAQRAYARQTRELLVLQRSTETDRFSKFVAKLCFSGQIADGKKKKLGPDCSALIAKDTLYIQGEHLAKAARKYFNNRSLTLQGITAELRSNGLLEMDKSNRSSKKVNGVRYLQIPIDRLEAYYTFAPVFTEKGLPPVDKAAIALGLHL